MAGFAGVMASHPEPITKGLVLFLDQRNKRSWPGSGSTWYDISGNGKNATLYNNPSKVGINTEGTATDGSTFAKNSSNELYFNGTTGSALYQYAGGPNIGSSISQWTISTWFYLNSLPASGYYPAILTTLYNGSSTVNFMMAMDYLGTNPNQIYVGFFDGSSWHSTVGATLTASAWYNVSVTYDGTTLKWYVNNVAQTSVSVTSTTVSSLGYHIGRRWDTADSIDGYIPVVQVYNRALSAGEVQQNFNVFRGRYKI